MCYVTIMPEFHVTVVSCLFVRHFIPLTLLYMTTSLLFCLLLLLSYMYTYPAPIATSCALLSHSHFLFFVFPCLWLFFHASCSASYLLPSAFHHNISPSYTLPLHRSNILHECVRFRHDSVVLYNVLFLY
jgi:hypothetical protein